MSLLLRDDIVTPRLSLIAITPEMLFSEKNGDGRLSELIQCVIPANWPLTDWEPHVFDFLLMQFAEHPEQLGWPRYISFEGARAPIDYLRGNMRLSSVIAHTFPSIPASIRVMEKCGRFDEY